VRKLIRGFVVLALSGCATSPLTTLGPDHPASPQAAEAPLPAASDTLSAREPAPAEERPSDHGEHHGH
jgi:hypothetical protein